jgi:hypothetical protein
MKWTAVAVAVGALSLVACRQQPENQTVENEVGNEVNSLPSLPIAEPPMNRSAMLLAVAKVASAVALGRDGVAEQRGLDGKRFEVRIRFGCVGPSGPASAAGPFNVRFDEEERTLRIRATPDLSQTDPRVAALGGEAVEAVEGFWMYRPWLFEAGCPAPPPAPPAPTEAASESERPTTAVETAVEAEEQPRTAAPPTAGQRVGIAHFFTKTDSRAGRRDSRAYEATEVLPVGSQPSRSGYDLVLSGRLATVPGGKVINCRLQGPNMPPECIVSAEFDRVRIETPGTKEVVAEWSN